MFVTTRLWSRSKIDDATAQAAAEAAYAVKAKHRQRGAVRPKDFTSAFASPRRKPVQKPRPRAQPGTARHAGGDGGRGHAGDARRRLRRLSRGDRSCFEYRPTRNNALTAICAARFHPQPWWAELSRPGAEISDMHSVLETENLFRGKTPGGCRSAGGTWRTKPNARRSGARTA